MTCIVGIQKNKWVWIGGDSAATSLNGGQKLIQDSKVFKVNNLVFGVCGLPKVLNHLKFNVKFPNRKSTVNSRKYISSTLLPLIKKELIAADCVENTGGTYSFAGAIMFGYAGVLYTIQSNFQVINNAANYDAIGSGSEIALGSLHSTRGDNNTKRRILSALEASAANNSTVRPPYSIVKSR